MSTRKKKNNTTDVPLFSPEMKETVRRLKQKENELEMILDRDEKERDSCEESGEKTEKTVDSDGQSG